MNGESRDDSTEKSKSFLLIVCGVIVVLCIPILAAGCYFLLPVHNADAGFRKAKRTIDSEQLRSWALNEIRNRSATNGFSSQIPQSEIPDYIRNLYPEAPEGAWVNPKTEESEGCVMIMWGGGFFHWGLDIGPTNLLSQTNGEYPQAFQWCPGIYYRHEASWGLL